MARVSYLLIQTFKEKQNEQEKSRGTFQVLDGNILMLVLPLNSELVFYKVSDANSIALTDSLGNDHSERMQTYTLRRI
ncbi:hypothetical protein [Segatella copri]|uniref:Copper resistance protein NlpE n=2 Tax=Bacteroidales TaxID=171549 RepID=A0AAW9T7F7_9BACT|nr:hypothetical protein [Segatella copri]MQN26306.1 copper resistance protein NlpE [Segatella copri]MQN31467.1 copper resistance protein NlpE [Segatella copri]MQN37466.1 copper resistance protein NlpE [Segatella copri]MQN75982.1 copper resistance protein NlpE [Segatella copri]MQO28018.1 copper resistance protein NlpE [Segatella copri]